MSFGRLERTPGPQPMSEINMTPLVDVMLVLVVIFIITAPLLVGSIHVDLPKAHNVAPSRQMPFVALILDKSGQVYVDEQPVEQDALQRILQDTARQDPETEVRLRADAHVPYGRVVELMGWIHKAGLSRIGFVTEPPRAG
jgi:biopolymer transport protein TolR